MSEVEADALTAEVVAQYLKDHPDFFVQRPELVDRLSLPHADLGAVSLVHIQMNRQRQRIEELEEEITTLMSLAANNDRTFYEFMDLQGQILKCDMDVPEMGSYVVLPLVKKQTLGVLAFSSEDGGHFQPDMDTLFLRHLSLVVAHLAQTLVWQSHDDDNSQHSSAK
ncbi:3',5'-cyclic-nucleotide phosphodiesterase [Vibrio parahaemolyticus]|nr:3',5'-cyclic-nucleotide phosphodiesterase [Vibrio parahaemolyticus]